jgi:hypothetical protein
VSAGVSPIKANHLQNKLYLRETGSSQFCEINTFTGINVSIPDGVIGFFLLA